MKLQQSSLRDLRHVFDQAITVRKISEQLASSVYGIGDGAFWCVLDEPNLDVSFTRQNGAAIEVARGKLDHSRGTNKGNGHATANQTQEVRTFLE